MPKPTLSERAQTRQFARSQRTNSVLSQLNPEFAFRVAQTMQDLQQMGWDPVAHSGFRTIAEQKAMRDAGKSKVPWSFHQATGPGGVPSSMAVHITDRQVGPQNSSNKDHQFWRNLEDVANNHGLTTGRQWKSPSKDVAHVQLYPNAQLPAVSAWVHGGSMGAPPPYLPNRPPLSVPSFAPVRSGPGAPPPMRPDWTPPAQSSDPGSNRSWARDALHSVADRAAGSPGGSIGPPPSSISSSSISCASVVTPTAGSSIGTQVTTVCGPSSYFGQH